MLSEDYRKVLETLDKIPVDTEENFINTLKSIRSSRWVKKVSRLIKNGSVEKHVFKPSGKVVWLVQSNATHLIIPTSGFCSCLGFFFNLMRGKSTPCAHLVVQKYCEKNEKYKLVEHKDSEYDPLIQQIIAGWSKKKTIKGKTDNTN